MTTAHQKYYLSVRSGSAVGPHQLDSLREWAALGVISPDAKVCREGGEQWMPLTDIPGFSFYPEALQERLNARRACSTEPWWSELANEDQLEKLQFFDLPFNAEGLTKGRAAELLDAFVLIDPRREKQYQNRPATAAQEDRIRSLGGDPLGVSYTQAETVIQQLEMKVAEEEKLAAAVECLAKLDAIVNNQAARQTGNYRKLTKGQLQELLDYLSQHIPNWNELNGCELSALVPKLFPCQVQVQRPKPPPPPTRVEPEGGRAQRVVSWLSGVPASAFRMIQRSFSRQGDMAEAGEEGAWR